MTERRRRRQPRPLTAERAWEYLLFLLSRRQYTVAELRARLTRRGLPAEEAEPLLERLAELRLVDDALYAELYVSSRQRSRGRLSLRRELRQKGVDEALVERELRPLSAAHQTAAATALLEKNAWRYRPTSADPTGEEVTGEAVTDEAEYERSQRLRKARAKAFAFLARRGFPAEAAAAALEQVGWFDES